MDLITAKVPLTDEELDINADGNTAMYFVANHDSASIHAVSGSWGSAVITVMRSIFDDPAHAVPLASATTISASGITGPIDCSSFRWLVLRVTTPKGSAGTASIRIAARKEP